MIEVTARDLISGQVLTSQSSCQILQIPVTFKLFDESSLRYSLIISVSTAQLSSLFWVLWMCHWLQSTWNCKGHFPLWFSFVTAVCLPLTFLSFFFLFQLSIHAPSAMEAANTTACSSLLFISIVAASQITCWRRMASTVHVSAWPLV